MNNIKLIHEYKQPLTVNKGFNIWVLLFGGLVPLFKGDIKNFLIMLIGALLTYGIANIFFAFKYNEWLIDYLINKGYKINNKKDLTLPSKEEISEKINNLSFMQKLFTTDKEIIESLPKKIKAIRFIYGIVSIFLIIFFFSLTRQILTK